MYNLENSFDRPSGPPSRGVRGWLNDNATAAAVGALAVLVVAMFLLAQHQKSQRPIRNGPPMGHYYDMVTHEYFVDDATKIPPIKSPSGNDAVRARFYACGGCEGETFLGYYERYTKEAKQKLEEAQRTGSTTLYYHAIYRGHQVSADGVNWMRTRSPNGGKVYHLLTDKCPKGESLHYCPPDDWR